MVTEAYWAEQARKISLPLRVEGGRVFIENATADYPDPSRLELACRWTPSMWSLLHNFILIGDQRHKPLKLDEDWIEVVNEEGEYATGWGLSDCAITLTLYRADEHEKWVAENAAKNDGKPTCGQFTYYAASEGAVRPGIDARVVLGPRNYEKVRERLLETDAPDFEVSIRVEFPEGSVNEDEIEFKRVTWDGKGRLPILDARIVWNRGDWDTDAWRTREKRRERELEKQVEPSPEHVELMSAVGRLERALARLAIPLWLAVAVAFIAVVVSL